jgi:hypothetical protein
MWLLMIGSALAYEPVEGIDFSTTTSVEEFEFFHDINLKFSISRQKGSSYSDELVYRAIYSSSLVSFQKIQSLGAINKKCVNNDLLEIFEISESQLNDSTRFPKEFIGGGATGKPSLWGYFDPRIEEPGYNAIVISPHSEESNYRILVHEIAHHWYSTFCLDSYAKTSSEEFANLVQEKATWR